MFSKLILIVVCFISVSVCGANTIIHKNSESGLLIWSTNENGFSFELIQLLPDFIRAIYGNHEFPPIELERIANYCVFGTIIKNTSKQVLRYNVSDWYYVSAGIKHRVKTKSQWLDEWRKAGIMFSWTLLPESGVFEVGDWQQGFTTIALPRNAEFDLTVSWKIDEQSYRNTIKKVVCAPEYLPET